MSKYGEFFLNADDSTRKFTKAEIDEIEIQTLGIRDGSHPSHSREVNQSTVACEYLINPAFFERFCAYMLGGCKTYVETESGITRLSRLMPQRWPSKPKFGAVKIPPTRGHKFLEDDPNEEDLEEEDEPLLQVPTYDRMRVPVLFQHMPFEMADDYEPDASVNETRRYMQILPSQSNVEYLTLPGGVMKFVRETGTATPHNIGIPQNIGMPLIQAVVSRKWHRLPPDAWGEGSTLYTRVHGSNDAATLPYLGTFNNSTFMGYQPGTLLLIGCDEEVVLDQSGDEIAYNLTYRWLRKTPGHCHFYFYPTAAADADKAGWYFVARDGTWRDYNALNESNDGVTLFSGRNHYKLFRVGE